jgi:hypothetical protein
MVETCAREKEKTRDCRDMCAALTRPWLAGMRDTWVMFWRDAWVCFAHALRLHVAGTRARVATCNPACAARLRCAWTVDCGLWITRNGRVPR